MAKKSGVTEEIIISDDKLVVENRTIYPTGFRNIDTNIANRVFDEVTDEVIQTNRGVLSGSMITFIGNSHTGKSTLLFQILGNMIRPFVRSKDTRVKVHIFDIENGVNMNRLKFLTNFLESEIASHFIQEIDLAIEDLKTLVTNEIETKKKLKPDIITGTQGHKTEVYYPTFIVIDAISEMIPRDSLDITNDDSNTMYMRQILELDKIKKRYKIFMKGKNAKNLEDTLIKRLNQVDELINANSANEKNIKTLFQNMQRTYQKMGLVKYDAFNEMGGKLSFSLAMLDVKNNGFIINAMHTREGCYTYIKEIIDGISVIVLSGEEQEALNYAMGENNIAK